MYNLQYKLCTSFCIIHIVSSILHRISDGIKIALVRIKKIKKWLEQFCNNLTAKYDICQWINLLAN